MSLHNRHLRIFGFGILLWSLSSAACGDGAEVDGVDNGSDGGDASGADTAQLDEMNRGPTPWLHVEGNAIRDPNGNLVVLRGASMMNIGQQERNGGLEWMVDHIVDPTDDKGGVVGWYPKVVRLPVYPPVVQIERNNTPAHPYPFSDSGEETNEQYVEDFLRPIVDYTARKGLYAIIDFHQIADVDSSIDKEVSDFWTFVAPRFADYPNVLYEVFNEPIRVNGSEEWADFHPYAQAWVDLIRAAAPQTPILMGGPMWSQNIGDASELPLTGGNVAYVSHIYPSHWTQAVPYEMERCAAVHPVVITEWGFDNGEPGLADSAGYSVNFKKLINAKKVSWTAWALSRDWLPRMLQGSLSAFDLTDYGAFAKQWLYEERDNDLPR